MPDDAPRSGAATPTAPMSRVLVPPDAAAPRGPSPTTWVAVRRFTYAIAGAWLWAGLKDGVVAQAWWLAGAVALTACALAPTIALAARRRALRSRAAILRSFCEATLGIDDAIARSARAVDDAVRQPLSPRELLQLEARLAYLGELLVPALSGRSIEAPLPVVAVQHGVMD